MGHCKCSGSRAELWSWLRQPASKLDSGVRRYLVESGCKVQSEFYDGCLADSDGNAPQKITSILLKELDTVARNGIKDELASLNPLLRGVAATEDVREQYDFEGNV